MMDAHGENNSSEDKEHDKEFHNVHGGASKRKLTTKEVRAQGVLFFVRFPPKFILHFSN